MTPKSTQQSPVLWFTGISSSGKTTLANLIAQWLRDAQKPVVLLDGDDVRAFLSSELGFSEADIAEHIRRVAAVSRLVSSQGVHVVVALISPYRSHRALARSLIPVFFEVHCACDISVAVERDIALGKDVYGRADRHEISNVAGVDIAYEAGSADVSVSTDMASPRECMRIITAAYLNFVGCKTTYDSL